MLNYAFRRLLSAIPTLFIVVTLAFFMMRLAPGGPFDQERALPPDIERNMLAAYNLDQPLWRQYLDYVGGLLQGDFGPSFKIRDFSVAELIASGFPASLKVGGLAIFLALVIGVSLGTLAALRQNSASDYTIMGFAMTGIAIPNFVMAPLLTLVFGVYLSWLPVSGWGGGDFQHLLLPVLALALPQVAYIARLTRGSMVEVFNANYIRTARAKGLSQSRVVIRHAMKNSLIPVVTVFGPLLAAVVTGSFVIERIFGIPGMGEFFVTSITNRDYPLVQAAVLYLAVAFVLVNLIVDILYAYLDPRIKQG